MTFGSFDGPVYIFGALMRPSLWCHAPDPPPPPRADWTYAFGRLASVALSAT